MPFALNRREVCKKVLAATIGRDETKALAIVEPFNCTCNHVYFSCNDEMTGFLPVAGTSRERERPEECRLSGYDGLAIRLRNLHLCCTRIPPLRQSFFAVS
jgi:hypothetical protein